MKSRKKQAHKIEVNLMQSLRREIERMNNQGYRNKYEVGQL